MEHLNLLDCVEVVDLFKLSSFLPQLGKHCALKVSISLGLMMVICFISYAIFMRDFARNGCWFPSIEMRFVIFCPFDAYFKMFNGKSANHPLHCLRFAWHSTCQKSRTYHTVHPLCFPFGQSMIDKISHCDWFAHRQFFSHAKFECGCLKLIGMWVKGCINIYDCHFRKFK